MTHAVHFEQGRLEKSMNKLLPALSTLLFAWPARAAQAEAEQPTAPAPDVAFGDARNLVIAGGFSFAFSHVDSGDDYAYTSASLSPSIDYFVLDHLSIGTALSISHNVSTVFGNNLHSTFLAVNPRVGYEIPLGKVVSLWPTLGVSYSRVLQTDAMPDRDWFLSVGASAPLLVHVAKHFFVGGGPYVGATLADSRDPKSQSYGVRSVLGGWL
jgi:hypothetical protein